MKVKAYIGTMATYKDEDDTTDFYAVLLENERGMIHWLANIRSIEIEIPDQFNPKIGEDGSITIEINGTIDPFNYHFGRYSDGLPTISIDWKCDINGLKDVECNYKLEWYYTDNQ